MSETWYKKNINSNLLNIPNYKLIRHDRENKRGGGVAIYLREGINFKIVSKSHQNTKTEYLFIEISSNDNKKLIFGVIYNPPPNTSIDPLKREIEKLSTQYHDLIFTGDLNIDLLKTSAISNRWKDFITSLGLNIISKEPTNFNSNCKPSLIDLCVTKSSNSIKTFSQINLGSYTTHDLIFGSYNFVVDKQSLGTFRMRRNIMAIDSNSLLQAAQLYDFLPLYQETDVDNQVNFFTSFLKNMLDRFAPLKRIKIKENCTPWLTKELRYLINQRDFLFHTSRKEKNKVKKEKLIHDFKKMRNKVNSVKKRNKALCFQKKLDPSLPSQIFWKNLKRAGVTKCEEENCFNHTPDELNNYFTSVFTSKDQFNSNNLIKSNNLSEEFNLKCISDEEIAFCISMIGSKAVGEDDIPITLIKKLCPTIIPHLTYLINQCITKSFFPSNWKIANIKPIPKISKPTDTSDYRPISILPVLSKILERIIKMQLDDYLQSENILNKAQNGFRRKMGTNTALITITDEITEAFELNDTAILCLLDLKKAFDLVDHSILLKKLSDYNFSSSSLKMIESYLSDRQQRVKLNSDSISQLTFITSGVPQGGILSATLFSLYINDLPENVSGKIVMYADDTQILVKAPNRNVTECVNKMDKSLSELSTWAKSNKIVINPLKSQALIFNDEKDASPPITLDGLVINYVNSARNLGLFIDNKLKWNEHITQISRKVFGALAMLRQSASFTPQPTRIHLVKSLIVPIIEYCSNIFAGCSCEQWDVLNRCYNACVRYAYGLRKFESLSTKCNEILGCNLKKFIQFRTTVFIHKLIKTQSPFEIFNKLKFMRSARHNQLIIPINKKKQRECSFLVNSVKNWNSLPDNIRDITDTNEFIMRAREYHCKNP